MFVIVSNKDIIFLRGIAHVTFTITSRLSDQGALWKKGKDV